MDLPTSCRVPFKTESMFFLERKNQRTFANQILLPNLDLNLMDKVFLLLFLQKKKTLAFLPSTSPASGL